MKTLMMIDKVAIALCWYDYPLLNDYLVALDYESDSEEGILHFNLGSKFYQEFINIGFTVEALRDMIKGDELDLEYEIKKV